MTEADHKQDKPTTDEPQPNTSSAFTIQPHHQHPDPIISRLRLVDGFGNPITNPKQLFRDCEVVGFFFATIWHPQKEQFHNDVLDFTTRHPHRFKCIYVSIDSRRSDFERATSDKAWLHMVWEDGSNIEEGKEEEDDDDDETSSKAFISPHESDLLSKIFKHATSSSQNDGRHDDDDDDDRRPISRVSLVERLSVLSVPTLSIYHLEKGQFLDSNVRISLFESHEQRERAWETWQRGERLEMSWSDIFRSMKWTIILVIVGIIYTILVQIDDAYNIVHLTERFMNLGSSSVSTVTSTSASGQAGVPPAAHAHYAEF